MACQQGTLTLPPNTWFRPPFWDLIMLQLLSPNSSSLPCRLFTSNTPWYFLDFASRICFEGVSHPVFYGDIVYKLRRVNGAANFVSSFSKIVKRLRRQKFDQVIIERTIGLVLAPSEVFYSSFLKRSSLIY